MATLGNRLTTARELAGLGKKAFHRQLEDAGVKGSSYPSVRKYLSGAATPSLRFLEVAAELCQVRVAWLAFGDGAPTDERELERVRALFTEESGLHLGHPVEDALSKQLPGYMSLSPNARAQLWDVLSIWSRSYSKLRDPEDPEGPGPYPDVAASSEQPPNLLRQRLVLIAANLGRVVASPIKDLPIGELSARRLSEYVSLMSQALVSLFPEEVRDSLHLATPSRPEGIEE